ncbi:hypothetical protein OED01_00590 [Microbacterium sp. M28]|uniref:hypothetical protein n=1 Tax=Microbacterium sp. M28 TaxID=2962064 RepID=UPI0021F4354E|nr:hypothetical protein [Microbacterium sp. M28]UYO97260.1 hypothetical protein OED01_00590 [Microbacterium sp. M28]
MTDARGRARGRPTVLLLALALGVTGCTTASPEDWRLESIAFRSPDRTDVAFGMAKVTGDGEGGFWSASSNSWLHVDADGETAARFNADVDEPLSDATAMATLAPGRLVVVSGEVPSLAIVDTSDMSMIEVPVETGDVDPLGVLRPYGDVAAHDGVVHLVRYAFSDPTGPQAGIVRIPLAGGAATIVHTERLAFADPEEACRGLPPVAIDVSADGRLFIATPAHRIVLDHHGVELSREPQKAERPVVAVAPDGTALWWGEEPTSDATTGVIVGGSGEARDVIADRENCRAWYSSDSLLLTDSTGENGEPLSFLCGANAAAWTGDAWVVAIGGEGDGVLVRLTPPG